MRNIVDFELNEQQEARMHDLYRRLHSSPELSMQESRTAEFLEHELEAMGLEVFRCGGTGVVGTLRNGEGPVVGYRADMDALPIREETGLDYASSVTGTLPDGTQVPVMHGCGHDTHMSVALMAAELLSGTKTDWAGTIVFIFQPGEETAAGAKAMLNDGLWEKAPNPQVIYGQHVWPILSGTVNISTGTAMAMADSWKVTVHGRQAHGSQPDQSIDPIVLAAHMVIRIQTIVAREVPPMKPAVVTIGTFHGGLKENIIPAKVEFTLNVRTFDDDVRATVLDALRRIISAEAAASKAPEPIIEEISNFPRCYNDPAAAKALIEEFQRVIGDTAVFEVPPVMGSEDFGVLAEAIGVPSVYWMFGAYTQDRLESHDPVPGNHSPSFAPDIEPTLTTGLKLAMTAILSKTGKSSEAGAEHGI
ncbi:M20 family metallopeptidase [Arthrobacter alkaliphilus]|uniref:amidohydrolase n=1 Tax=Arthrobacter alkaliphilus TaxID=369936 RepID=UPI001F348BA2|nr:amidohydrolase [Arthrobacter alkaliphilus]